MRVKVIKIIPDNTLPYDLRRYQEHYFSRYLNRTGEATRDNEYPPLNVRFEDQSFTERFREDEVVSVVNEF